MIMKSRFSIKCYILLTLPFLLTFGVIHYLIWYNDASHPKATIYGPVFFVSIVSFTSIWLLFGELRNKMVSITIDDHSISARKFAGLSESKKYHFSSIDGFKISVLSSRGADNEYLYIMKGKRKLIKISDFYHKNYQELKEQIELKTTNLGYENFSYIDEIKEIFY